MRSVPQIDREAVLAPRGHADHGKLGPERQGQISTALEGEARVFFAVLGDKNLLHSGVLRAVRVAIAQSL